MADTYMSPADMAAITNNESGSSWMWIIVLFLFLFGGNGGWFGNNRQAATTDDVQNQFNFSAIERQMNEGVAATRQAAYDVTGAVKDVAYTNLSQIRDVESMVQANGYQQSQNNSETNRNIDAVRYEGVQNTSAITTAIHNEAEATRALINANTVQSLRDKVADLQLQQSQCAQNAYLVNMLRPYPMPSYPVGSPYGTNFPPFGQA